MSNDSQICIMRNSCFTLGWECVKFWRDWSILLAWAKIGFLDLFGTFFRIGLSALEAEIHRFFMLQLSWYTLYIHSWSYRQWYANNTKSFTHRVFLWTQTFDGRMSAWITSHVIFRGEKHRRGSTISDRFAAAHIDSPAFYMQYVTFSCYM